MIFVYSGTGSSYQAARRMADELGQPLVDIAAAVKYERFSYNAKGSDVGIVVPTHDAGVCETVRQFAESLEVRNHGRTFVLATCGEDSTGPAEQLQELLGSRLRIDALYDALMPDNRVDGRDTPTKEEAEAIVSGGMAEVDAAIASIRGGATGDLRRHASDRDWKSVHASYDDSRSTEPFVHTDKCCQCRICAQLCPTKTIVFYSRYPSWDEEECDMCMGCVDMCPWQAIEYGEGTVGRRRWYNPAFYEKVLGLRIPYDIS